jgi:CHRD domain-containing protein
MRRYYSLAVAALVLGCTDDGSKATAPRLSGAVVGASLSRDGDNGNSNNDNPGHSGQRLTVTLLTGDEEVPPRETHATGQVKLKLNPDGQSIDYVLEVKNITNITQAHIHMAPKGTNGGIVVWLFPSVKSTTALPGGGGPVGRLLIEGTFSQVDLRGALAGHPLSDFLAAVQAGNTYGNVHTDDGVAPPNTGAGDFPGGEIRGQLDTHGH